MSEESRTPHASRRDFLKATGQMAAVSALSASAIPYVHAQGGDTVQVALIGCGGRGTGAAEDALRTKGGPIKLVAMADVVENRLKGSFNQLSGNKDVKDKVSVPPDCRFIGFDGYRKAMDLLGKGDVAILTTPLAFRWVMFKYAIERGINVFMEKPLTADGPTSRRMLELAEEASKKNLKVGVGLMVRHCKGRQELFKRIRDGEIGEIMTMRAYRMKGPEGSASSGPKPEGMTELLYQIKRFHSFLWASGGCFSDFYIHQIDECCWMKDAWPIKAEALGGRHYRGDSVDQNFDTYSVEYTFADGARLFYYGRTMPGCVDRFHSAVHATKGAAVVSRRGHSPGEVATYKGQNMTDDERIWAFPQPEPNPYRVEWQDLIDAIRNDKPYNEVPRGVQASLVTSMGRMAAHTGQIITYDQILHSKHEYAPDVDKIVSLDSPAPVRAGPDGKYPVPEPGIKKDREY
jgi:predicted dehydrogenase